MNRLHKLLLIILGIAFITWADQQYAHYKYNQKVIEAGKKSTESKH